jgi:hypothetical protein
MEFFQKDKQEIITISCFRDYTRQPDYKETKLYFYSMHSYTVFLSFMYSFYLNK